MEVKYFKSIYVYLLSSANCRLQKSLQSCIFLIKEKPIPQTIELFENFRMERRDDDSSDDEDRWQTMGFFNDVLFVVYTERGEVIRIISARVAEPFERRIYHGNSKIHGWQRANP